MATALIETPHVYEALGLILYNLRVEKGGVLPGNMGGKPYITAVDASAEVKRQFVKNKLIFLPNEEVIANEHIIHKDRLSIRILIRGSYTIVSTVDGSQVTVSGTGDGLATGTAVASNIASTNALKNALLRTFLITEQSVEDAAKNGEPEAAAPQRDLNKARGTSAPAPAGGNAQALKKLIGDAVTSNKITSEQAGEVTERLAKKLGKGKYSVEVLTAAKAELGL